jgi:hypothetical protein
MKCAEGHTKYAYLIRISTSAVRALGLSTNSRTTVARKTLSLVANSQLMIVRDPH